MMKTNDSKHQSCRIQIHLRRAVLLLLMMINDGPYSRAQHSWDALSGFDPCRSAAEPLCAAQWCSSAASKRGGPSQCRTHRPRPWAPGARAAWTQSSPSTRLKGVKSA
ncbi:hypothetical protein QQF64_006245 [Cirrhinus molitorella]|uniref:Uncharacterized protein n=1 Tax=Cirrhinus molitorella TaxID=172907 RepID=A0ABR3MGQ5_9TELE